jgi:hypothetical protein
MPRVSERWSEIVSADRFKLFRLYVTGVEVTQAIQHYRSDSHLTDSNDWGADNSLRLVTEKPAWVRVYVWGLNLPTVTGTLEVQRRRLGILWAPLGTLNPIAPGTVTASFNPDYTTQRGTLGATLNFIIPAEMMCGTLRLVARVASGRWTDSFTTDLTVTLRQTLRLAGVMIAYNGPQSSAMNAPTITIAAPTVADLQAMSGRALTLFPVRSAADFRAAGTITWNRHLQDPFGATGCTTNWDALHAAVVNARTADGNQAGWVYYGLLPNGVPMGPVGGCGGGGVSVGPVGAAGTLAHEVAHACGLDHAPCGGAPRPDPNFPTYEPYGAASIGEYGLDVNNGNISSPVNTRDFMSYCAPSWISPYHHGRLVNNNRLNPTEVCVDYPWWKDLVWEEKLRFPRIPIPDPPPFDQELPVFPPSLPPMDVISLIVRIERPQIEGAVNTGLVARLRGDAGQVLSEAPLLRVPREACECGGGQDRDHGREPDSYLAQAFVPDVAPGSSLEISDGKDALWGRTAPSEPVTITAFNARLRERSVSATWRATGTPVEFWLRYSTDGETWQVAATGIREPMAEVDARLLPSGKILLQVVAHDGFFSAQSKSVELTVPRRPPDVAILHPHNGFTYVAGQTLRLWGAATAADGRPVPAERCSWSLDGRAVGRGLDVWIEGPTAGTHELMLTVDGDEGEVSARLQFVTTGEPPTEEKTPSRKRRPKRK